MTLRFNDRRASDVRYAAAAVKFGRVACTVEAVYVQRPDGQGVLRELANTSARRRGESLSISQQSWTASSTRTIVGSRPPCVGVRLATLAEARALGRVPWRDEYDARAVGDAWRKHAQVPSEIGQHRRLIIHLNVYAPWRLLRPGEQGARRR
jgi:hypothetical protein